MSHLSFTGYPKPNINSSKDWKVNLRNWSSFLSVPGKFRFPIPDVVLKIQRLCLAESTSISDVADCLIEDPGLSAIVIRVANSVVFNRRNITCTDIVTAVSRLGILRVRDIVTAQAIEQLKYSVNLSKECNRILLKVRPFLAKWGPPCYW